MSVISLAVSWSAAISGERVEDRGEESSCPVRLYLSAVRPELRIAVNVERERSVLSAPGALLAFALRARYVVTPGPISSMDWRSSFPSPLQTPPINLRPSSRPLIRRRMVGIGVIVHESLDGQVLWVPWS